MAAGQKTEAELQEAVARRHRPFFPDKGGRTAGQLCRQIVLEG
jgi:hypothetical protein